MDWSGFSCLKPIEAYCARRNQTSDAWLWKGIQHNGETFQFWLSWCESQISQNNQQKETYSVRWYIARITEHETFVDPKYINPESGGGTNSMQLICLQTYSERHKKMTNVIEREGASIQGQENYQAQIERPGIVYLQVK